MPVIETLRAGKAALRRTRQNAPLEEKILDLWRAQHVYVQIVGTRRALRQWEHPWNIMDEVRDAVIISADGRIESTQESARVSGSQSQWVRPQRPWIVKP